ncbi:DUF4154 domain-containing protein [candidate division KSB1 bacterium]|nr:DUF4154 domain-containing protein [candidate division KSB1 bacterium]
MKRFFSKMIALSVGIIALGSASFSSAVELPIEKQADMLIKIMGYNKSIESNSREIRIGILYSEQVPNIEKKIQQLDDIFYDYISNNRTVKGKSIQYSFIPVSSSENLKEKIKLLNVSALYVFSISDQNLQQVINVAKQEKIFTYSGTKSYFNKGVAVVVDEQESSPKIFVDVQNAKDQGAQFNAELLKIAKLSM